MRFMEEKNVARFLHLSTFFDVLNPISAIKFLMVCMLRSNFLFRTASDG